MSSRSLYQGQPRGDGRESKSPCFCRVILSPTPAPARAHTTPLNRHERGIGHILIRKQGLSHSWANLAVSSPRHFARAVTSAVLTDTSPGRLQHLPHWVHLKGRPSRRDFINQDLLLPTGKRPAFNDPSLPGEGTDVAGKGEPPHNSGPRKERPSNLRSLCANGMAFATDRERRVHQRVSCSERYWIFAKC